MTNQVMDLSVDPERVLWDMVAIQVFSPNGENVISNIVFLSCRECGAMVCGRNADSPPDATRFDLIHIAWHRGGEA